MTTERQLFGLALGKVIRGLRKRRELTQVQLGGRVEGSQSAISRIELGAILPDAYDYWLIATALGMSVGQLDGYAWKTLKQAERIGLESSTAKAISDRPGRPGLSELLSLAAEAALIEKE